MIDWLSENPAVVAGLFTIIGAVLLKLVENWLHKNQEVRETKQDYRDEIQELHARLDKLEEDLAKWRALAQHLEEELTKARIQVVKLGGEPGPRALPPH